MSTHKLTAFEKGAISALSSRASLASALLSAWAELPKKSAQNARSLVAYAQLGVTEERASGEVLETAVGAGLLDRVGNSYVARQDAYEAFPRIAFALSCIQHYLSVVHQDMTRVKVTLTKPPRPSVLEEKLAALGWRTTDIEATAHAFNSLVRGAQHRVVVMTPFFDERGATWLQELFGYVVPGIERVLVLRSLEDATKRDYPTGFATISSWLKENHIHVYNYSILRLGGRSRETFHAKMVMSDRKFAYIGSSNVTAASLDHSMEMGVLLEGSAVAQVAEIVDAVLASSTRIL